ncbi:hypothetical protein OG21DRAFT_1605439 [Imleria badia]|nr:hypothetical protein OG21DRAFT_1605439 [Imleria badia]
MYLAPLNLYYSLQRELARRLLPILTFLPSQPTLSTLRPFKQDRLELEVVTDLFFTAVSIGSAALATVNDTSYITFVLSGVDTRTGYSLWERQRLGNSCVGNRGDVNSCNRDESGCILAPERVQQ